MEIWMLISAGSLTYISMGFIVSKLTYNHYINRYFNEYKTNDSWHEKGSIEAYEYALDKAKSKGRATDLDMGMMFGGIFWPVWLPIMLFTKLTNSIGTVKFMQSKPEREIAKMKVKQAITDSRKKEWSKALSVMEESGIDTKELRKMKVE